MATKTKAKTLTARGIEALESDPVARREIPDGGAAGLYLVIQPSGAKSWAFRYRLGGKPKKVVLGAYPEMSLAGARRKAEAAAAAVERGDDPAAEKRAEKARQKAEAMDPDRDLVKAIVADFLKRHVSKNRTADDTARIFRKDVLPKWGERRLDEITRRDVIDLLDGIVDRGSPVMANRVLAAVRKLCNWAVSRDILAASPCAGVKRPGVETSRERVLSDDELRLFWRATGELGWPFGPLFRFLLLTAQRREEAGDLRRVEITETLWTIPATRAKNGKEHPVALSAPALLTLAACPRIACGTGYVFTTTGDRPASGYSKAKARLDAIMLRLAREDAEAAGDDPDAVVIEPWRLHDLRRTAASGMARCGVNLPVIERVLNHVSGSFAGVAGVYNRWSYADETRRALDLWAAHVLAVIDPERGDNVVNLAERAKAAVTA
ncbi:MAG: site-specific integrase [Rhodobacteraceae bacterium]|nr:MAG: site-specific integrase [Paracoccaceae bacterium]